MLATRSTVQSEVLSRITTFFMLVSTTIVSLALIGQVTRFDGRFITFALVLLGMLVGIGTLTQPRVGNAAIEDLAHVIGMNRLRDHDGDSPQHHLRPRGRLETLQAVAQVLIWLQGISG